jgi:hypothetical protein
MKKFVILAMVLGVLTATAFGFAPQTRAKELGTRQWSRVVQETRTVKATIVRDGPRRMHEVGRETGRVARDGFSNVSRKIGQGLRNLREKCRKMLA